MVVDIGLGMLCVVYVAVLIVLMADAENHPPRKRSKRVPKEKGRSRGRHSRAADDTDVYAVIRRVKRRRATEFPMWPDESEGRRQHRQRK